MSKDEAIKYIDDLIKDYKEASLRSKYNDLSDLHNDALTKSIEIRALNIIEAVTEEGSVYRKQAYHQDGHCVSIPKLMGILEPLKSDIEADRLKLGQKTKVKQDNTVYVGDNSIITKESIGKLTIGQLLRRLSISACLWLLMGIIFLVTTFYKVGYKDGYKAASLDRNFEITLESLSQDQLTLVKEIWKYQKANKLERATISRDGYLLDEEGNKDINLMKLLVGNIVDQTRFERLITSVPVLFLKHLSKVEFNKPYIVSIPEKARKYLD